MLLLLNNIAQFLFKQPKGVEEAPQKKIYRKLAKKKIEGEVGITQ